MARGGVEGRVAPGADHPGRGCDGRRRAPDPVAAATWGLICSAQSEHPGRFSLIDTDASEASRGRP